MRFYISKETLNLYQQYDLLPDPRDWKRAEKIYRLRQKGYSFSQIQMLLPEMPDNITDVLASFQEEHMQEEALDVYEILVDNEK